MCLVQLKYGEIGKFVEHLERAMFLDNLKFIILKYKSLDLERVLGRHLIMHGLGAIDFLFLVSSKSLFSQTFCGCFKMLISNNNAQFLLFMLYVIGYRLGMFLHFNHLAMSELSKENGNC